MAGETWSYFEADRGGSNWIGVAYSERQSMGAAVDESVGEQWTDHGDNDERIVERVVLNPPIHER